MAKNRTNGQSGYAPKLTRPSSLDRLGSKKAFRVFHDVVLDNEKALALEEAKDAYDKVKDLYEVARTRHLNYPSNKDAEIAMEEARAALAVAAAAHEEAREDAADAMFRFVLRMAPMHVIDEIQRAHPPTDEEKAEFAKVKDFPEERWPTISNTTIGPAMIAACLVDPVMTEEQVRELIWDNGEVWNDQEKASLLAAVWSTNNRATVSLGKVSGATPLVAPNKPSVTD